MAASGFPKDIVAISLSESDTSSIHFVALAARISSTFIRHYFRTKTIPDRSLFVLFIDAIRIGTKMAAEEDLLENPTHECRAGARTEAP